MARSKRLAAFHAAKDGTVLSAEITPALAETVAGEGTKKPKSPEDPDEEDTEDEDTPMTNDEIEKMKADVRAETSARFNTVLASEHYVGREAAAHKMLGKEGMSAADIVDVLADLPRAAPVAATGIDKDSPVFKAAVEDAKRAAMKEALPKESENADLLGGTEADVNAKDEDFMVKAVERRNAAMAATA